ncbi:MAP3K12-binding inhibitory protein 1-like [Branchiostoma floridae]|uniref:MAP3K12-binding inhibitory protein 1-like n=1 Tax=Branchiostoma floridae TaxID=7739 RepID=A0A9J7KPX0_BRAFL|nr:MAP3K12-binding inhibitory protein 1-like [Branchiostoma floridae]XP_035668002.1 MAP3K12-binding inhibitory protein 1-like [Branchiostoma floridae]
MDLEEMEAETLDGEPVLVAVLDAVKQFLDKMKVDPSAASLHLDRTKLSQQQVAHEMVTEHLAELCNKLQSLKDTQRAMMSLGDDISLQMECPSPPQEQAVKEEFPDCRLGDLPQQPRPEVDPNLVQIKASKAEIERRIQAFLQRKQTEIDENNRREFGAVKPSLPEGGSVPEPDFSCARTDAVYQPRVGRSHIRVCRVVNPYGPQTRQVPVPRSTTPSQTVVKLEPGTSSAVPSTSSAVSEGIEERLRNMESHLKVKSGTLVNTDIYSRLKQLENRILHLEGLSPEYFQLGPAIKFQKQEPGSHIHQEMSIEEIEERMKTLRESLLSKKDTLLYPTTNTDDFQ